MNLCLLKNILKQIYYNGKPVEKIEFRNSFISPDGDLILIMLM